MLQKSLVRAVAKNATAQNPLKKLYVGTKSHLKSLGGEEMKKTTVKYIHAEFDNYPPSKP